MARIQIIFFDIDGTLVDMHAREITPKMLQTLKDLQKQGIRICLATGRIPRELPNWPDLEFDGYLTFNGSFCYTPQEVVFSNSIPGADVERIIANAAGLGRPVALATRDDLAANGQDPDLAEYFSRVYLPLTVSPTFSQVSRQEIYQIMLGCRPADYPAILHGVSQAKIAAWWDRAVDVIPANGGKGVGIQKMLAHFGIPRENALAFGDGDNDLDMLQAVGLGVAMGNASPNLKAVADDVCGSVREEGIYHYCRDLGLLPV